ncbi:hypothetical protein [Nonomuraea dietziae]
MDDLKRARRLTWKILIIGFGVMWLLIAVGSVIAIGAGKLP